MTTEYHTLRTPIWSSSPHTHRVRKRNTHSLLASTAMVTSVCPVPWNRPMVLLYTPLEKHQNAMILRKSAAMAITSPSSLNMLTMAVEIGFLDNIIPPMNKKATQIRMEILYPCSALSCCCAPIFCPTIVAVAEPIPLEGNVIRLFTLLPIPYAAMAWVP